MRFLLQLLVSALAVLVAAYVLPGVHVTGGFGTALLVALVLGFLNAVIKPVLAVLTLPLTILTLGIFYLILNALMVEATSAILNGFKVDSLWSALFFSLLVSVFSAVIGSVLKDDKE